MDVPRDTLIMAAVAAGSIVSPKTLTSNDVGLGQGSRGIMIFIHL
jgi:hypothetical protein